MTRQSNKSGSPPAVAPADKSWNVREAKAHLSEVVSGALKRPQRIARRDGASVVVLNEQAYRDLLEAAEEQVDMVDYFRSHAIDADQLALPPRHRPRNTVGLD